MSLHVPATDVVEFLSDRRFHRCYILPPSPETGRQNSHRFSYADFGDPHSNAVVLFCGGLMAARYCYSPLDQLAKKHNVRILQVDRPGIGGTEPIELEKRIQIWLEMVPQFLRHLDVPYISLASHSGGSIYLLNTLLVYPHLLHPHQPYVCLFAPYVRPTHSKVVLWQITSQLPAPLLGKFASIAKVVNNNVMPLIGLSGSLPTFFSTPASGRPLLTSATPRSRASSVSSDKSYNDDLDMDDPSVLKELRDYIPMFLFAERLDGVSDDVQLFLKPHSVWCSPSMVWSDIDHFVPLLSKIIKEDSRLDGHTRMLTIDAFHAASDIMVGEKGQRWWDACWLPGRSSTSSARSNPPELVQQYSHQSYEYRSEVVKGTDHDFLVDPAFGASAAWLQRVRDAIPLPVETLSDYDTRSSFTRSAGRKKRSMRDMIDKVRRLRNDDSSRGPYTWSRLVQRVLFVSLRMGKH